MVKVFETEFNAFTTANEVQRTSDKKRKQNVKRQKMDGGL